MNTKKRVLAVLSTAAVAGVMLAGCSANNPSSSSGGATTWASPTAKLKGVSLTIWAAESTATVAKKVIASFDAKTGASVKIVVIPDVYETNVPTKLATGDKPDLMFYQATQSELNLIQGTKNLQNLDGAPWLKKLETPYQSMGVIDGNHYAAVIQAPDTMGVYYNKADFKKAGITTIPKTYAQTIDAAKKLKAAGIQSPIYEAGKDQWPTQWAVQSQLADLTKAGFWTKMNENKASFTDADVVKVIQQYDDVFKDGLGNADVNSATFADQATQLYAGTAGMEFHVSALIDQMLASHSASEVNKNIGFFAVGPTGPVGTTIYGQANTVVAYKSGNAKKEAAARQFLEYWVGPYYQTFVNDMKYVSTQKGVKTPASIPEAVAVQSAWPETVGSMQTLGVENPDLYLNLSDMLAGTKTPEQVAQTTQDQFAQLAKAQGVKGF
jgi:raffinose/stachyose/melibiose transport system substrate-binding protein